MNAGAALHKVVFFIPNLIVQPEVVFRAMRREPAWALPLLIAIAARTMRTFLFHHPERTPLKILLTVAADAVPVLVTALLCALLFRGLLLLAGARSTLGSVFSAVSGALCAYTVVHGALAGAVLLIAADGSAFTRRDPVLSNLGFLADPASHPALHYLASSADLLSAYHAFLIALGLHLVSDGLSRRAAAVLVMSAWAAYVAVVVAIKAAVA